MSDQNLPGRVRIAKRIVDTLCPDGTDFYVFDSELIGFGIRVRKTGGMSYIARYRAGAGRAAPVRRVTIAPVGKVTPDQARKKAADILASVVKGGDPARDKKGQRDGSTFTELANQYLAHVAAKKKPKTYELYKYILEKYLIPKIGKLKVSSVTPPDLAPIHLDLSHMPVTANRVLNVTSSMYGWAAAERVLIGIENPAKGIERYHEPKRERFLTSAELQRLGAAIREAETVGIQWDPDPAKKVKHAPKPENRRVRIDQAAAAAIRLFILTGARLQEILKLTWEMVDLERGLLLLPDSKTREKTIILNAPALAILSSLPRVGRFVFPGKPRILKDGTVESRPRSDMKRPWHHVRKRAGLDASAENPRFRCRIHDLRHTFASVGVAASFGLPIVGRLLGHDDFRSTERYAHLETDPLIGASNTIGRRIVDAMGDGEGEATADAERLRALEKEIAELRSRMASVA